jgi:hypothetical protein
MGLLDMWSKMIGYDAYDEATPVLLPEPPKPNPIKALVHLIKMDMKMYPNEWTRKDDDCYHVYLNDKAEIVVKINQLKAMRSDERCSINGIEVGEEYVADIERVFQQRDLQSLLEKLLDRVEKIEKVDVKQIQEAKRLELVDPFTVREDHMVSLQKALTAIENAGTSSMKPKPIAIASTTPKLGPPSSCSPTSSKVIRDMRKSNSHVDTWKAIPLDKLTPEQKDDYYDWLDRNMERRANA